MIRAEERIRRVLGHRGLMLKGHELKEQTGLSGRELYGALVEMLERGEVLDLPFDGYPGGMYSLARDKVERSGAQRPIGTWAEARQAILEEGPEHEPTQRGAAPSRGAPAAEAGLGDHESRDPSPRPRARAPRGPALEWLDGTPEAAIEALAGRT